MSQERPRNDAYSPPAPTRGLVTVERAAAAGTHRHAGTTYAFCSALIELGRGLDDGLPNKEEVTDMPKDPVCGKTVDEEKWQGPPRRAASPTRTVDSSRLVRRPHRRAGARV